MPACQQISKENAIMSPKSLVVFLEKWLSENANAEDDYQLDGQIRKNNPTKWVHFRYRGLSKKHYGIFAINGDTKLCAVKRLIQFYKSGAPVLFEENFTEAQKPRLALKEDDFGFYCYKLAG